MDSCRKLYFILPLHLEANCVESHSLQVVSKKMIFLAFMERLIAI